MPLDRDWLFLVWVASAILAWVASNLLYWEAGVFLASTQITLVCLGLILAIHALSALLDSVAWGVASVYGLLVGLAFYHPGWLVGVFWLGGAAALLSAIRRVRVDGRHLPMILLLGALTALLMFSGQVYTSFNMMQRLDVGLVHQDTLFHASMAAMIKSYGVVSTGLNGLVPVAYHVLSHALLAAISVLASVSVIETYGVATWVFFGPLLVTGTVACIAALDREGRVDRRWAWILTCLSLVVAPVLLQNVAAFWNSYLASESDLVALGLFVLSLPLLFKQHPSGTDRAFLVLVILLMTTAKATVGLVYAGLWGARWVFLAQAGRRPSFGMALMAGAAVVASSVWVSAGGSGGSAEFINLSPFDFLRYSSAGGRFLSAMQDVRQQVDDAGLWGLPWRGWWLLVVALKALVLFFFFHFLATWCVVGLAAWRQGTRGLHRNPVVVYCLASFLAGAVAVALFEIPGGAVYYATNLAFFVALPFLIAELAVVIGSRVRGQATMSLAGLGAAVAIVAMSIHLGFKAQWVDGDRSSALMRGLSHIRMESPATAVFTLDASQAPENPVTRCTAQPFVFPAVSERAWLGVIPADAGCPYQYYGYPLYGLTDGDPRVSVPPVVPPGSLRIVWPQH